MQLPAPAGRNTQNPDHQIRGRKRHDFPDAFHLKLLSQNPMHCGSVQLGSQSKLMSITQVSPHSISAPPPAAMIRKQVGWCLAARRDTVFLPASFSGVSLCWVGAVGMRAGALGWFMCCNSLFILPVGYGSLSCGFSCYFNPATFGTSRPLSSQGPGLLCTTLGAPSSLPSNLAGSLLLPIDFFFFVPSFM